MLGWLTSGPAANLSCTCLTGAQALKPAVIMLLLNKRRLSVYCASDLVCRHEGDGSSLGKVRKPEGVKAKQALLVATGWTDDTAMQDPLQVCMMLPNGDEAGHWKKMTKLKQNNTSYGHGVGRVRDAVRTLCGVSQGRNNFRTTGCHLKLLNVHGTG